MNLFDGCTSFAEKNLEYEPDMNVAATQDSTTRAL